jgi:hypothetical protein
MSRHSYCRSVDSSLARVVASVMGCLLWAFVPIGRALDDSMPGPLDQHCGPRRNTETMIFDWRERTGDPWAIKQASNLEKFHVSMARRALAASQPHAPTVTSNLDYALRHCPNHYEAMQMLIRWELGGGKMMGYPDANCYLDWARQFVPDDDTILTMGGTYFWKKGQIPMAQAWYRKALEVAPASAEANYNYGLVLFDLKQYDEARQRAKVAYGSGYPLPGLRRKLEKVGYPLDISAKR